MTTRSDKSVPSEERRTFRFAFLPVLACGLAIGIPGIVVIAMAQEGLRVNLLALAIGIAGGTVVGIVLTGAVVAYFKVYVSTHRLRCFDFWGLYHDVSWAEIVGVKPINFLGLRYLRLSISKHRMRVWLPLFLNDFGDFRDFVRDHVDESNALVQELERASR
jgi:hypothetical protein